MFSGKIKLLQSSFQYLIFRTLADLAEYAPTCNEGPDSRSLVHLLSGTSDEIAGPEEILTHAVHYAPTAIRWKQWKLIPQSKEFYNIAEDLQESTNLFGEEWAQPIIARLQQMLDNNIARINSREERTNFGQLEIC